MVVIKCYFTNQLSLSFFFSFAPIKRSLYAIVVLAFFSHPCLAISACANHTVNMAHRSMFADDDDDVWVLIAQGPKMAKERQFAVCCAVSSVYIGDHKVRVVQNFVEEALHM